MRVEVEDDEKTQDLEFLVSHERTDKVSYTYSGTEIRPLKRGLPKDIESLCPECGEVIPARLFDEDGKVLIDKTCPEHGYFKDIYWSDVELYLKAEKFTFGEGKGLLNPNVTDGDRCPYNCGICNQHISHTVFGNIDLTNRCNMSCPICFANSAAAGYVYEPSLDEVKRMLRAYRDMKPVPGRVIQFSGGEPTIHPQFFKIVAAAKEMGYTHIQMASNGIKLADPEFCRKTAEAGMHTVYLQFDGTDDESHVKTRGRSGYFDIKLKALENMRRYDIHVVFTPTIVRGLNDHMVGPILEFAIQHAEYCSGIAYQPVAITGRIDEQERAKMRYTMPDLAIDIEKQTGIAKREHWYPISCASPFSKLEMAIRGRETINITCHPHCSLATYLVLDATDPVNTVTPLPEFIDVPGLLDDMNELAFKIAKSRVKSKTLSMFRLYMIIRKHFDKKKAPKGLTLNKFLSALRGLADKDIGRRKNKDASYDGTRWKFMLIGAMHFMDAYNYDVDRVKRCVIHYSTPDGMFPFCTYNSGPLNREKVEKNNSIPLEQYKAEHGKT